MKNTVKNMFSVLAFQLAVLSFALFSMDTPMQEETGNAYIAAPKHTVIVDPSDALGRREMIGRWLILAKAETNEHTIIIGRIILCPHPKTELRCINKNTYDEWKLDVYTPERHCSTYDHYDATFSPDGSLFAFAEYNDDSHSRLNPHHVSVRITVIDLHKKTKAQYLVDGGIGDFAFGTIKLAAISSDGTACARLVKDSRLSQPSIIITQLTRGDNLRTFVFDLDNSLGAPHINFTKDNKRISVQGTQETKFFELDDAACGWTHYGYEGHKTKHIGLSHNLLPEKIKGYTKPFIGMCDEAACKMIQNAGFPSFQQDDLVIYTDALAKEIGISLLPVKPFIQNNTAFMKLADCTHVWFSHNIRLKAVLSSPRYFETTLFSYAHDGNKYNPPMIAAEPSRVLGERLKTQGSLVPHLQWDNPEPLVFKYALSDIDSRLTLSITANHHINEKIITQTLEENR